MTTVSKGLSASAQDYLKAIYYQTCSGQPTSTVALAEALGIRAASVTNMIQKLASNHPELVSYRKHYGVCLTTEGEKEALFIIRHHRLIEQFLYKILGYPVEKVHEEAENLEHAVSPFFINRLAVLLDDPPYDPHGAPIPDDNLVLKDSRELTPLSDLITGSSGIVRQITDQTQDILSYLQSIGIHLEATLKVMQKNPIDNTQQIVVNETGEPQVLGKLTADTILVERKIE